MVSKKGIDRDPSPEKKGGRGAAVLKALPLLVCLALIVYFLFFGDDITAEAILSYTPKNPILAAVVLLLLYALKSLSVVFPIIILQVCSGILFSRPAALLVNFLGRVITLVIPYWIGRFSGSSKVDSLLEKYPKLRQVIGQQNGSPFFISLFLRLLNFLPGDVVSMYLGATKTPFLPYILGGALGTAPGVLTATLMGTSISNPTSPGFILSIFLMAALAVGSAIIHRQYEKKHQP